MHEPQLTAISAIAKAQKCRKAAELSSDPAIREELLSLADAFEAKAEVIQAREVLPELGRERGGVSFDDLHLFGYGCVHIRMPSYTLQLHDGGEHPIISEAVQAADDEEAKELANIHLLLTTEYHYVTVIKDGRLIGKYLRDSLR
jgi:hypothetical protein